MLKQGTIQTTQSPSGHDGSTSSRSIRLSASHEALGRRVRPEANHRRCFMVSNKGNTISAFQILYLKVHLALPRSIHAQWIKKPGNNHVCWLSLCLGGGHFPSFGALCGLVIVVNNMSHLWSELPGVSRHGWYMVLLIHSWDKPLWLRRPCSLPCFSPSHSQVMGKKESKHPPCSAELHRRGWKLLHDSSSSCRTSLTAGVKLWVTGCERPQTWDILRSWSASGQSWEQQLTSCNLLGPPSKNTCLQLGITIKVT